MKRIGVMGLALMLAVAMSAVMAVSASVAYQFKAAQYPVHVLGKFTNPQGFEFTGGVVVVCRQGTLKTGEGKADNPITNSPILEAHPTYTNCTASGSSANVRTTGCIYRFHAVAPSRPEGSFDIACLPHTRIEVEPAAIPVCVITIRPPAAPSIEFRNENGKLRVNAEVIVRWNASSGCAFAVPEGIGSYREGEAVGSVTKLAPPGHPASALLEGFNSLNEADPIEVAPLVPRVTNVEPDSGSATGGTTVTLTGTDLGEATSVTFGPTAATSFAVISESSIIAVSPPGTETVDVTVATPGGTSATSSADQFTYGPTVSQVKPSHGPPGGGTSATITGTGFTGATAVMFGSTSAKSFTVNSATSITAVSPQEKGTVDVTVTTPAGTSPTSAADQFTYSRK
jgi:hypothetical protein